MIMKVLPEFELFDGPFKKEYIKRISFSIDFLPDNKIIFNGTVQFRKIRDDGFTSGIEHIEANNYKELLRKIELFVKNI